MSQIREDKSKYKAVLGRNVPDNIFLCIFNFFSTEFGFLEAILPSSEKNSLSSRKRVG